jgi:hypothetical protein
MRGDGMACNRLTSTENWTSYGKVQDAFYSDPKAQAVIAEAAKLATWQTYVAQTLDL